MLHLLIMVGNQVSTAGVRLTSGVTSAVAVNGRDDCLNGRLSFRPC
jgi:hypothetical protein